MLLPSCRGQSLMRPLRLNHRLDLPNHHHAHFQGSLDHSLWFQRILLLWTTWTFSQLIMIHSSPKLQALPWNLQMRPPMEYPDRIVMWTALPASCLCSEPNQVVPKKCPKPWHSHHFRSWPSSMECGVRKQPKNKPTRGHEHWKPALIISEYHNHRSYPIQLISQSLYQ